MSTDTAPLFTEYSSTHAGQARHSITCERDGDHWILTLKRSPINVLSEPPTGETLTGREWGQFIAAQSTAVACRRVPRRFVQFAGERLEARPGDQAAALAREVLGRAWTVSDGGRGFTVELSHRVTADLFTVTA